MLKVKQAAPKLGCSERHLYRMLKNPDCPLKWYNMPYGPRLEEKDIEDFKIKYKKDPGINKK